MVDKEPLDNELEDLLDEGIEETESDSLPPADASLDDLWAEADSNRKLRRPARQQDLPLHAAVNAAAKRIQQLYSNPDNWKAGRGLVLVDRETQTVIGNFREWTHRTDSSARKFIREHSPMQIDGKEELTGFLGERLERELRGRTWDREVFLAADVTLDELQVAAPAVPLNACVLLGTVIRLDLAEETQFACHSGNLLLKLPAGTDIWSACNVDTKAAVRKAVSQ